MTRIVRTHYRYKPPPRKRKPAVALAVPAVVTIDRKTRRRVAQDVSDVAAVTAPPPESTQAKPVPPPSKTVSRSVMVSTRPSAIVTARKPGKRYVEVPEMTPDEHQRRGDLADAMIAGFKRVIAEKSRS